MIKDLQSKLTKIVKIENIITVRGFKGVYNVYCDLIINKNNYKYLPQGILKLRDDIKIELDTQFNLSYILVEGDYDRCFFQINDKTLR